MTRAGFPIYSALIKHTKTLTPNTNIMRHLIAGLCLALFTPLVSTAQEKSPVKFGKVGVEDFDLSKKTFDTSVSAVVISDVGSSKFEGNSKGWFTLVFKHQKRFKILNKNGFEAAKVEIPLYFDGEDEEKLADLKAFTYNLENGQVVKTELASSAVFKDKLSKNLVVKKFTFPAVKEGSIIEYSYTINSDFLFNLQPWEFQGGFPRLWSEYNVSLPEFFVYVNLAQGYQPFYVSDRSQSYAQYNVVIPGGASADEHLNLRGNVTDYHWVMKDVPALKEESFTSSIDNHIAKIEFQLSQYRFPDMPPRDVMGTWLTATQKMLENEKFGATLSKNNGWMDDEMKTILAGAKDEMDKAQRIYAYVRDNFTCTDHTDLYLNNPLKVIFKNKNGSVADINLLLVAMLRQQKIATDPVILSTRSNGFASDLYPLMNRFNYVIAAATINGNPVYLDATHPMLGFGKLPAECYNGMARIMAPTPMLVDLAADSLREAKQTVVFLFADDKGNVEGSFKTTPGYYESLDIRESVKEKGEAEYFKKVKNGYTNGIEIKEPGIDSLKQPEKPLAIHYNFKLTDLNDDIVYFNPMLSEGYKTNYFKAAERLYPVEMPYTFDETYLLTMEIPKNYVVDEVPKSTKVAFNDTEGFFEYIISKSDEQLMLRSRVVLKKANFTPEDYNSLREFFAYVIKKHGEQIVLKKKK